MEPEKRLENGGKLGNDERKKMSKKEINARVKLRTRQDVISRTKCDIEVELKGHSPCTSESKIYLGLKQKP